GGRRVTQLPVWASPEWATAAISFFVAGVLALVWGYWFAPTKGTTRVVAALLKLLGLGLLAMFLVEPLLTGTRPRTGANLFAMAVDDSQSLTIHEPGDDATRGEQLQRTLLSESSWQTRLERD